MIAAPADMIDRPDFGHTGSMTDPYPWASSDPLAAALHTFRMSGSFYCRSELTAPWGLAMPALPGCLWFHVVTTGAAMLDVGGEPAVTLGPGVLALVPHGQGHDLRSAPGDRCRPILSLPREVVTPRYEVLRHGGGGAPTVMVCGAVTFDDPAGRDLLAQLPPVLRVEPGGSPQAEWLRATIGLMAAEAGAVRPGAETVITRLADVLVIQAIRDWLETSAEARTGWLGALRDPRVGPAIAMIHRDPGHPWTVARLADAVAMSRSSFAERFAAVVGEAPLTYVTRWRMRAAREALASDGATVAEVAARFGYGSEAAFGRAFRRATGVPPGAVRRGVRGSGVILSGSAIVPRDDSPDPI
jgi:AraC-like DNA-binding protein